MKQKTICCLKMCSMKIGSEDRAVYKTELLKVFPEKVILRKLEELADRGQIEYGTSIWSAWLTDKGKEILKGFDHSHTRLVP